MILSRQSSADPDFLEAFYCNTGHENRKVEPAVEPDVAEQEVIVYNCWQFCNLPFGTEQMTLKFKLFNLHRLHTDLISGFKR